MKPILTLFCILTSFLSLNAQSNAELGVGAMGLVVSDIEASEEFYTKILGLTPIGGFSLDEQWSKEAVLPTTKPSRSNNSNCRTSRQEQLLNWLTLKTLPRQQKSLVSILPLG